MRYLLLPALLALGLTGCGTPGPERSTDYVPADAGDYFTVAHSPGNFERVFRAAAGHCAQRGKQVRHTGTDIIGGRWPVRGTPYSRFECVPK